VLRQVALFDDMQNGGIMITDLSEEIFKLKEKVAHIKDYL
jgi:hypothetical protein